MRRIAEASPGKVMLRHSIAMRRLATQRNRHAQTCIDRQGIGNAGSRRAELLATQRIDAYRNAGELNSNDSTCKATARNGMEWN